MKRSIVLLVLLSSILLTISAFAEGSRRVRGYWRDSDHDGTKDTYVQPYQRSNPDSNPRNNYDYPGNYNPNRGEITPGDPNRYMDRYNRDRN